MSISSVVQNLSRFNTYLVLEHKLSSTEYAKAKELLDVIDASIAALPPQDGAHFKPLAAKYRYTLESRNPNAWKIDYLARAIIAATVVAIYGIPYGWKGGLQALAGVGIVYAMEATGHFITKWTAAKPAALHA
jgi:hypothetical protein